MRNDELVRLLSEFPPDMEVVISDGEFCSSYVGELYIDASGDVLSIEPGEAPDVIATQCAQAGHPITHAYGGSGPRTHVCACGEVTGDTICGSCGGPWAAAEHNRDCIMYDAMGMGRR